MDKHSRLHKYYRLEVRIIEEVDVWEDKEDSQGGSGYYPAEILVIGPVSTPIADKALPSVITSVITGNHDLNQPCKSS